MTDKIKIVTYCHRQKEIASSDSIDQMPLYIAQELDGECEDANSRYTSFLWHIILHSSDIGILILDNLNGFLNRLGKWYRWLNPMGKLVTFQQISEWLHQEDSFSVNWTEKNYRLWTNQVLLPRIGFTPLAESYNII